MLEPAQGRSSANQRKTEWEANLTRRNVEKPPEAPARPDETEEADRGAEQQPDAKVKVARSDSNWDYPHERVCSSLTP